MKKEKKYVPQPVDTSDVQLPEDVLLLAEKIARNVHDVWAQSRIEQGWKYGQERDDDKKETPCLVDYDELSETEKQYDRDTAFETLKLILKLGFRIEKDS